MRYYKKCQDCNGQGKLAKRGSNYHLSISCPCEGGFVDCTAEIEAMRDYIEKLATTETSKLYRKLAHGELRTHSPELEEIQTEAKKLLESMKG